MFDREGFNWGLLISLLACAVIWSVIIASVIRWWDVIGDWLLVAVVIAFVIGMYFVVLSFVDDLIEYWKAYRDAGPPR